MKNYFIKNKKGEYLYQIGEKLEFKQGLMLALAFSTQEKAKNFCVKILKNSNVDIECVDFD